jgi:hypothetical protein
MVCNESCWMSRALLGIPRSALPAGVEGDMFTASVAMKAVVESRGSVRESFGLLREGAGIELKWVTCEPCDVNAGLAWRAMQPGGAGAAAIAYLNANADAVAEGVLKACKAEKARHTAQLEAAIRQVQRWPSVALGQFLDRLVGFAPIRAWGQSVPVEPQRAVSVDALLFRARLSMPVGTDARAQAQGRRAQAHGRVRRLFIRT